MSETEYSLGLNCGITFAGIKPSSLFWLKKSDCGNLIYFKKCFHKKGFGFVNMREKENKVLVYVFNKTQLKDILFSPENRSFLRERGFEYSTLNEALCTLKAKIKNQAEFPHEIGIFLGYPLEDVKGFIENPDCGVLLCGYWKVYENFDDKAVKFKRLKQCEACIKRKMDSGKSLVSIFNAG